MSYADRLEALKPPSLHAFYPLYFGHYQLGWIHQSHEIYVRQSPLFSFNEKKQRFSFSREFEQLSISERSRHLADFALELRTSNLICNWRDELYGIYLHDFSKPVFAIERGAVPFFAFKAYGVHVNAFTNIDQHNYIWVAKRSASRIIEPLKYDQIAAGGLPYQMPIFDNVLKECEEEASIPPELSRNAVPAGSISYLTQDEHGLRNDTLFCFDLFLPQTFTPQVNDGEVEDFYLMEVEEIKYLLMETTDFKANSAAVMLHFLLRHQLITLASIDDELTLKKALNLV